MDKTDFRNSLTRVWQLTRIFLVEDWRPFILTGVIFGALAFVSGLLLRAPSSGFLFKAMLLVGIVQVSRLFAGLQYKDKGAYLMLLPAAMTEKFLVQWLASLLVYFLFAIGVISLGGTLSNLVATFIYQTAVFRVSYPVDLISSFRSYLFFHAIFFTGALVFKRSQFLKTSLVVIAVSFALMLGVGMYLQNSLMQRFSNSFIFRFNGADELFFMLGDSSATTFYYAKLIVWILIPALLYLFSFYRFIHLEVKG